MQAPNCPKCSSAMEQGFLFDRSMEEYGKATDWVEGAPETSFFFGTKTAGRERHRLISWRCPRCGYLESYAPAE